MKQTIMVGDKPVQFSASADTPRLYRIICQRDLIRDIQTIDAKDIDLSVIEQIAYVMAKEADSSIGTIDEWLSQFEMFDIYKSLSDIIKLWGINVTTTSASKKKTRKQ